MNIQGTLTIIPIQAFIIKKPNTRLFLSKVNPFLRFRLGQRSCQSKTSSQKGENPSWEEVLIIKKRTSTILRVQLIDHHNLIPNQIIGQAQINIEGIMISNNISKHEFWLKHDEQVTGKLELDLVFNKTQDKNNDQFRQPQSPMIDQVFQIKQFKQIQPIPVVQSQKQKTQNKQKVFQKIRLIIAENAISEESIKILQNSSKQQKQQYIGFLHLLMSQSSVENDSSLSITEMKFIQSFSSQYRNTIVSQVINIKHLFFDKQNKLLPQEIVGNQPETFKRKLFTSSQMDKLLS